MDVSAAVSYLLVAAGIVGGYLASVFVHELGHVAFGRIAGLRILGFGFGVERPIFHVWLGNTVFFVARPLTGGVTLLAHDSVTPPWRAMVVSVAGGPIASLALAASASAVNFAIGPNSFLIGCGLASSAFFLISACPMRTKMGGLSLANDAALIRSYWDRRYGELQEGATLATYSGLRELCSRLNSRDGVIYYSLGLAALQMELDEDMTFARETLADPIFFDPGRGTVGRQLETYLRATIAQSQTTGGIWDGIPQAESILAADEGALASLWGSVAHSVARSGMSAVEHLERALAHARRSGVPGIEREIEAMQAICDPPSDLTAACRRLLNGTGSQRLAPTTALALASAATQLLAERGRRDEVRGMFHDAMRRMNALSAGIADPAVRKRIEARYAASLQAAVLSFEDDVPLFVPERPDAAALAREKQPPNGLTPFGKFAVVLIIFLVGVGAGIVIGFDAARLSHPYEDVSTGAERLRTTNTPLERTVDAERSSD
jgi:hypothetical protein